MAYKKKKKGYPVYRVGVEGLSEAVEDILSIYSYNVTEEVKAATDQTAEETTRRLHEVSPKRTGRYAESWTWKNAYNSSLERRDTVYAAAPHYRLIHLLEFGHVIRNQKNGPTYGRVPAYPHVMPTVEYATQIYTQLVKEAIDDAAK